MSQLFDDSEFEIPLLPEPRRRAGVARGVALDARFTHDYPPEWSVCPACDGRGRRLISPSRQPLLGPYSDDLRQMVMRNELAEAVAEQGFSIATCPDCLGMGSLKARVRLEAGHRCVRCGHPFMTKHDAKMLGVEPSPGRWSPCDLSCSHKGPLRWRDHADDPWKIMASTPSTAAEWVAGEDGRPIEVEAEWRVLTVHHLDGDKANLRWWNLLAACQRCHLEVQSKVVMERVYPHEHSGWFKPYVAGYYALVYLGEELTRDETMARLGELLALERAA